MCAHRRTTRASPAFAVCRTDLPSTVLMNAVTMVQPGIDTPFSFNTSSIFRNVRSKASGIALGVSSNIVSKV